MSADPHLVALLGLPGLGPRRLRRLLDHFGDPGAAWAAVRRGRLTGVPLYGRKDDRSALVASWVRIAAEVAVDEILPAHRAAGIAVLTPEDPDWPEAFSVDPEPPVLAFVQGDPSVLSSPVVAIVGTRRCTAAGAALARELGHDLAAAGVGTVSGLALGIDGAAHQGCLAGGGPAVGVVATGLDLVYPARHADLWEQVATEGVLLGEAPMGTAAERWRFPARNRLIAALGLCVVVVESRRRGGSMLTVESALERDVQVLAVPGPVRSAVSAGTNQLLSEGCAVVRDATDVLVALGTRAPVTAHDRDPATSGPVADAAASPDPVLRALDWIPSSLDDIVATTGLSLADVAARLAHLELSGVVERVADGYQRRSDR